MFKRSFFKQASYVVLSFFLAFLFLEVFVRIFIPQRIVPNYTTSAFGIANALKANYQAEFVYSEGITYRIETNSKHLRHSRNVPYAKPENTFRILCLGDSILFGYGVNNDETFSHYLEEILNEKIRGMKFEVVNAGTPGWSPLEYYLFLKNEGYKYSPDLILVTSFIDDISHLPANRMEFANLRYERTSNKEVNIFFNEWDVRPEGGGLSTRFLQTLRQSAVYEALARSSQLLNLIRYRLSQLWTNDEAAQERNPRSLDYFIKTIGLKEDDKIVGVAPTWRTPILDQDKTKSIQYYLLMDKLLESAEQMKAKLLLLNLPTYQDVLGLVIRRDRLNLGPAYMKFDPLKAVSLFQNESLIPLYFPKDNHWTPAGHRLAAILTFNFIVENRLVPNLEMGVEPVDVTDPKEVEGIRRSNRRIDEKLQASPSLLFNKGIVYYNRGQLDLARQSLESYLQSFADDPEAYFRLSGVYIKKGNRPLAEEYLKKAIEKNPNPPPLYHKNLGVLYSDSGRHEEALEEFSQYLKWRPHDPKVLFSSGLSYGALGNTVKAMEIFREVLRLQPGNKIAENALEQLQAAARSTKK